MKKLPIGPKQKALTLNLDESIYGSFAEIGAGQEVARYFFQAGGASKTVAKTMSAYDMIFSDEIYGQEEKKRYVCESRLSKMLDHEYSILEDRLKNVRGEKTSFFAFANTVATSSYGSEENGHGWIGIRFQTNPKDKPSDFILHVKMTDNHALSQQQTLGILGVNLIYGVYAYINSPKELIDSLYDNLERHRLKIDLIKVSGPVSEKLDDRLLNMHLVKENMTEVVMFDEFGRAVLPSDHLYKKDILVVRGSYRPPTLVNENIITLGTKAFTKDIKENWTQSSKGQSVLCELSIANPEDKEVSDENFLGRIDTINAMGHKVLMTNFSGYYKLSSFFSKITSARIGLVLGAYNFFSIFKNGDAKILESLGLLFKENISVYVYPYREGNDIFDLNSAPLEEKYSAIINFLKENRQLVSLDDYDPSIIHIYSRQVFDMIQNNEDGWEKLVPVSVKDIIKKKKLFLKKN